MFTHKFVRESNIKIRGDSVSYLCAHCILGYFKVIILKEKSDFFYRKLFFYKLM